ncbi:unnamed protein product [Protopolystoma xenopodis]|uniref:Uncharacterized protein n=1 Tax=Protopolystoma xenopodis TaxID=117903 RepID=A0A3S5BAN0_9PLAT|nr:unnamed protein product [Protopolystoma xenopodis]
MARLTDGTGETSGNPRSQTNKGEEIEILQFSTNSTSGHCLMQKPEVRVIPVNLYGNQEAYRTEVTLSMFCMEQALLFIVDPLMGANAAVTTNVGVTGMSLISPSQLSGGEQKQTTDHRQEVSKLSVSSHSSRQ